VAAVVKNPYAVIVAAALGLVPVLQLAATYLMARRAGSMPRQGERLATEWSSGRVGYTTYRRTLYTAAYERALVVSTGMQRFVVPYDRLTDLIATPSELAFTPPNQKKRVRLFVPTNSPVRAVLQEKLGVALGAKPLTSTERLVDRAAMVVLALFAAGAAGLATGGACVALALMLGLLDRPHELARPFVALVSIAASIAGSRLCFSFLTRHADRDVASARQRRR
jgi:hypothetical protein